MNKLSYAFTKVLVNNKIIEKEDEEIYAYGARSAMQLLVGVLIILLEGILMSRIVFAISFLFCFSTLRRYFNGYHAKSRTACCIYSGMLFAAGVLVYQRIANAIDIYTLNIILISAYLLLTIIKYFFIRLPMIEIETKKILKKNNLKGNLLLMSSIVFYNLAYALNYYESSFGIFIALMSICLLYVIKFLSVYYNKLYDIKIKRNRNM